MVLLVEVDEPLHPGHVLAEGHVHHHAGDAFGGLLRHLRQPLPEPVRIRAELRREPELLRVAQDGGDTGGGDVDVRVVGALLLHVEQLAGRVLERAWHDLLVDQIDARVLAEPAPGLYGALAVSVISVEEGDLRVARLVLPVLLDPAEPGAQAVRIARADEEVVRRLRGVCEMGGERGGNVRDLVLVDLRLETFGVPGAPAVDHDDLFVSGHPLVGRHRLRDLVAVVHVDQADLLAVDPAVLVRPGDRVAHALRVGLADVRGDAGEIEDAADLDLLLGLRGSGQAENQQRR